MSQSNLKQEVDDLLKALNTHNAKIIRHQAKKTSPMAKDAALIIAAAAKNYKTAHYIEYEGGNAARAQKIARNDAHKNALAGYAAWKQEPKQKKRARINKIANVLMLSCGTYFTGIFGYIGLDYAGMQRLDTISQPLSATSPMKDVPLTRGEENLARSVFGDEIDYSKLHKNFNKGASNSTTDTHDHTDAVASVASTTGIDFWRTRTHSSDYSLEKPYIYGVFMHEMTHILQFQKGTIESKYCKTYPYTLTATSKFDDFCIEQQASIIGDYAMRFLHPEQTTPHRLENYSMFKKATRTHDAASDALLAKTVEARFPQAKITREGAKAQKPAPAKPTI